MIAGCSSDGGTDSGTTTTAAVAACVAVGETTPAVDVLNTACLEDGELVAAATLDVDCADGRTLVWNDRGWGYVGEPWQADPEPPVTRVDGEISCEE